MSHPFTLPRFKPLFRSRSGYTSQAALRRRRDRRPRIELLEDRLTPSGFVVSNLDYSGAGSLGDAIAAAVAAHDSNALITFSGMDSHSTLQLDSTTVDANAAYGPTAYVIDGDAGTNITIDGSGAPGLSIDGGQAVRLFVVAGGNTLTLENLTLSGGAAYGSTGGDSNTGGGGGGGAGMGGAVYDDGGTFVASGCTFLNNVATGGQGGSVNVGSSSTGGVGGTFGPYASGGYGGGGAGGNLNENGHVGGFGGGGGGGGGAVGAGFPFPTEAGGQGGFGGGNGGIGTAAYNPSSGTYLGSNAGPGGGGAGMGGGIFSNGGTLTLSNNTFTGNTANGGAGGYYASNGYQGGAFGSGLGGAVFARNSTLNVTNVTFFYNYVGTTGSDLYVLSDTTDGGSGTSTLTLNNSILGQDYAPYADFVAAANGPGAALPTMSGGFNLISWNDGFTGGLLDATDPQLSGLNDNGGPTQTIAPVNGSPVVDAADNAAATAAGLTTDQRGSGYSRIINGAVDLGAYESPPPTPPDAFVVTTAADVEDPDDGLTSLREAIDAANADANSSTITFSSSLDGTPITLNNGYTLIIDTKVIIQGDGQTNTIIDASGLGAGAFYVSGSGDLTLGGVTITGGHATNGGGIDNDGTLTVSDCTISGNTGNSGGLSRGAGIYNGGTATIIDSTFANNTFSTNNNGQGGGIYNAGNLTLIGSTLANNTALGGGGGLLNENTATVTNCTFTGNVTGAFGGGAIYNVASLVLTSSTLFNNTTTFVGVQSSGGLMSFTPATVNNSIIAGNHGGDIRSYAPLSGAHNLVQVVSGSGLVGTITGDPLLGPLADNGGPTQTFALLAGSPAIGAGDPSLAGATDQRGVTRGTPVSIGAYQAAASSSTITTVSAPSATSAYGQSVTFTATVTSGGPVTAGTVTFEIGTDTVATVSLDSNGQATYTASTLHVAGSPYTITAIYNPSGSYQTSTGTTSLTVTPAALTITANNASKVYGAALPALSASYSGFVNGDTSASLTTQPTLSTTATASSHVAGSPYAITASGAADSDYTISFVAGGLTVTPAGLTVTPTARSMTYGGPVPTLTYTYAGLVNGDTSASFTGALATAATASSSVGIYAITQGTLAATGDYAIVAFNPVPTVGNAGFESPTTPGYIYYPTGTAWTFSGETQNGSSGSYGSGIATNGSAFTGGNPHAPQGTQVAFLQKLGTLTQTIADWAAGTYTISFSAANRANYSAQDFQVTVDGNVVGTFMPATTTYQTYATNAFTVAAGSHTIQFVGLDSGGGDRTDFLDAVAINSGGVLTVTKATPTLTWANPAPITVFTPLSGTQLNAAASWTVAGTQGTVAGTFVYTPAAGTLLSAGTRSLSTTFTPADSVNYTTTTATVTVNVLGSGFSVVGTTLYVVGGNTGDYASINPTGTSNTGSTGLRVSGTLNGVYSAPTFAQTLTSIVIVTGNGNDNVQLASTLALPTTVTMGNGANYLKLAGGNDTVTLGTGSNQVFGGAGNKTITASDAAGATGYISLGNGDHVISLGAGNDQVVLGSGNNTVTAGNGTNSVRISGPGNNTITLGNGNNYVTTGNGIDVITLGSGTENVQVGDGNKTITAGDGSNSYVKTGNGNNVVTLGNGANANVQLGGGNNTVTLGNGNNDYVSAGNGNNTVTVGNGANANVQLGDGSNVVVLGNGNNNYIKTGNGNNFVVGGRGKHNIQVGTGTNILVDGSATVVSPATSFRQILNDWVASPIKENQDTIRSQFTVNYSTASGSYLSAGSGIDWFFTNDLTKTNKKSTDFLN